MNNLIIEREDAGHKLLKSRFFKYLSTENVLSIISDSEILHFKDEELIVQEGDLGSCFYVILDGAVNVKVNQSDKNIYVATLGQGDIFGEAAIFVNVKRTANVLAYGKVELLKLERDVFIQFLKNNPSAGLKILMVMIHSLLKKLKMANKELAFERTTHVKQEDIDKFLEEYFG